MRYNGPGAVQTGTRLERAVGYTGNPRSVPKQVLGAYHKFLGHLQIPPSSIDAAWTCLKLRRLMLHTACLIVQFNDRLKPSKPVHTVAYVSTYWCRHCRRPISQSLICTEGMTADLSQPCADEPVNPALCEPLSVSRTGGLGTDQGVYNPRLDSSGAERFCRSMIHWRWGPLITSIMRLKRLRLFLFADAANR